MPRIGVPAVNLVTGIALGAVLCAVYFTLSYSKVPRCVL